MPRSRQAYSVQPGQKSTKVPRGDSQKWGCQAGFVVSQLVRWPEVAQLLLHERQHVDAAGIPCHGQDAPGCRGTRHAHAPHLSADIKDWLAAKCRLGWTTGQIMAEHSKAVYSQLRPQASIVSLLGKLPSARDSFLTVTDIANIRHKIERETWKVLPNEAEGVDRWVAENKDDVFFYHQVHS